MTRIPESGGNLTIPDAAEDLAEVLAFKDELNAMTHSIPAGQELLIVGYTGMDDWEDVLATGYIMVYDQNNNLVDTFPLQSQPNDNTNTDVPVAEPADTMPAAENAADVPVVTDTATIIQPVQTPDNRASVETVAGEVIKGKWGVGKERRIRLEAAGYDYAEVQKQVSALMKRAS